MSLTVLTSEPDSLLKAIKLAIDEAKIRTWAYNKKGLFTHKAPQWREQAWLRPMTRHGSLVFEIVLPKREAKNGVEGWYHGKFAQLLQNHFHFSEMVSSTEQHRQFHVIAPIENGSRKPVSGLHRRRSKQQSRRQGRATTKK